VTVTATVENEGEAEGVFYAPLLVDGQAVGVETVTLAAGASDTVTYSYVATFGGSYEVVIGDQTADLEVIPSTMQNILKMVPADWNAFLYFGAETMRSDTAASPDKGLADFWAVGNSYLQFFADQIELDTDAYPEGDLPFTLAQLDYIAFGIGGLETLDFDEEGELPNMTLMIGGSFTTTQISSFLNNFDTNWADANISFVSGTYGTASTWVPTPSTPSEDFPDLLLAVVEGSTIILFGPADDVEACIDVIDGAGDADSMFENDNIRGIMGDFGNPVLMAVIDGNVPLPDNSGGDGPTLPDAVAITAGIAMEKTGDTMRLQAILEVDEMGDLLALLVDAIPTPTEFQENQEQRQMEEERQDEYWTIQDRIYWLMSDNWIPDGELPNPINEGGRLATDNMSMFPDVASVAGSADKAWDHTGVAFTASDKNGWLLFGHDANADGGVGSLWDYVEGDMVTTEYYYTCEADGTLRQWSAADLDAPGTEEYTPERYWGEPEGEPETE